MPLIPASNTHVLIYLYAIVIETHYNDGIMSAMASQITGEWIFCTTVCWGADQRKSQSSMSLASVTGIHRCPMDFLTKTITVENVSNWWRHQAITWKGYREISTTLYFYVPAYNSHHDFLVKCKCKSNLRELCLLTRWHSLSLYKTRYNWSCVLN